MPKGIPLTEEEQQRRRKEIIDASLHLFLERGFNETSMREIANAAGVGKSTLYDYFQSKEEILISYAGGEIQKITEGAREIIGHELGVKQKISNIMQMHLKYLVANKNAFLILSFEAQRLSQESQQRIQTARHSYQDMLRKLIEEGIQQRELRPTDPLLAARSILSLLSIVVYTTRPTGTPEEMLEEALAILFQGIQA